MATVTLLGSERSRRKARTKFTNKNAGCRRGDSFWEEEKERKNFGLKYMNKFGWNQGDGLGKEKQGDINHVKAKRKNDNKGIGCKIRHNDTMFQATMCMFNDILAGLNNKNSKTNNTSNSQGSTKHLSASSVIKSYEAKHHLFSSIILAQFAEYFYSFRFWCC